MSRPTTSGGRGTVGSSSGYSSLSGSKLKRTSPPAPILPSTGTRSPAPVNASAGSSRASATFLKVLIPGLSVLVSKSRTADSLNLAAEDRLRRLKPLRFISCSIFSRMASISPMGEISHGTRPRRDSRNIPSPILTVGDISPTQRAMQLISDIEAFVAAHNMTERRFGELALNDKNFVADIRAGRSPSLNTVDRLKRFMMTYRPEPATQ